MIAKSRLLKRAPAPNHSNHYSVRLGIDFELFNQLKGFKKLYESSQWIQQPYNIPRSGIIPAMVVYDPSEGGFIQVGANELTDKFRFNIPVTYIR